MKTFTFYKNNRIDQEFKLTEEELRAKFQIYLNSLEPSYLEYYGGQVIWAFIASTGPEQYAQHGLSSTYGHEDGDQESIRNLLHPLVVAAFKNA